MWTVIKISFKNTGVDPENLGKNAELIESMLKEIKNTMNRLDILSSLLNNRWRGQASNKFLILYRQQQQSLERWLKAEHKLNEKLQNCAREYSLANDEMLNQIKFLSRW